jgi:hypothetical protein
MQCPSTVTTRITCNQPTASSDMESSVNSFFLYCRETNLPGRSIHLQFAPSMYCIGQCRSSACLILHQAFTNNCYLVTLGLDCITGITPLTEKWRIARILSNVLWLCLVCCSVGCRTSDSEIRSSKWRNNIVVILRGNKLAKISWPWICYKSISVTFQTLDTAYHRRFRSCRVGCFVVRRTVPNASKVSYSSFVTVKSVFDRLLDLHFRISHLYHAFHMARQSTCSIWSPQ